MSDIPGGLDGGMPLVLFDSKLRYTMVLSASSEFMASNQALLYTQGRDRVFGFGVLGSATYVRESVVGLSLLFKRPFLDNYPRRFHVHSCFHFHLHFHLHPHFHFTSRVNKLPKSCDVLCMHTIHMNLTCMYVHNIRHTVEFLYFMHSVTVYTHHWSLLLGSNWFYVYNHPVCWGRSHGQYDRVGRTSLEVLQQDKCSERKG